MAADSHCATDTATATDNFLHDPGANGGVSNRSMHMQNTKSTPPCRFFIRGVCRNGAACRFSHDSAVNILLKADCETSAAKSKPSSNSQLKLEAVRKARREAKQRDSSGAGAREHAEALATPFTIVSHGWDQLTVDGIKAVVTYTNDEKTVDAWCDARRSGISADSVFMGLDTETKPSLFPGDIQRAPALLQLALRDGEECAVLLFAICHYEGAICHYERWPAGLVALLNDSRVYKSGVAVKGDVKQLRKHFPGLCAHVGGDRKHFHDVAKALTKVQRERLTNLQRDAGLTQGDGLKSLGALLFRDASRTVRLEPVVESDASRTSLSDWERYPLDHSQQVYAALDAVLSQALAVTLAAQRAEHLAFWKQPPAQPQAPKLADLQAVWTARLAELEAKRDSFEAIDDWNSPEAEAFSMMEDEIGSLTMLVRGDRQRSATSLEELLDALLAYCDMCWDLGSNMVPEVREAASYALVAAKRAELCTEAEKQRLYERCLHGTAKVREEAAARDDDCMRQARAVEEAATRKGVPIGTLR
jgi:hypothetical protein